MFSPHTKVLVNQFRNYDLESGIAWVNCIQEEWPEVEVTNVTLELL